MPTPSDLGNEFLASFVDLRDRVCQQRIGRGGHEVSRALSDALDRAIVDLASPLPERVAILALGGYGRREMSPFSDVDLMILHDVDDPSSIAANLFRPLWDAKLRVGHSVRTLKESAAAAKERFDTQTTLLTSRLVAGDRNLFETLMEDVISVARARPLRRHLVAEERLRRQESPFLLMAVDVKSGRGGLRTLHGFEWERRREALIGRFSSEPGPEEDEARESLIQVRNALHAVAGRGHDVFSVDLRDPVARWLDDDMYGVATRLVAAMQTVDSLATKRWPEVTEPSGPGRVWSRLTGAPEPLPADRVPHLSGIVSMLESGDRGRLAFDRLFEKGFLADVLPEWEVVRGLPQLAPFHEHPVDAHLWRTVAEMVEIISDGGRYQEVADDVDEPGLLLLAAFLHDIGKGHGGGHAEVGAGITARFCERLGVDDVWSTLLEESVRHHLLLARTATRRDLDDPAVIEEVAETVGSLRQLQILYLLTVADSRATGPTMWTDWKATLLRTVFLRCVQRFEGERSFAAGTTREELVAAAGERMQEVSRHVEAMPDDYLQSTAVEDVLWHVDLVSTRRGASQLAVRSGTPVDTAVVVGTAAPGFRRHVAEAFAANGIDVLEARLHTRADGLVLDSFQVRDDRTGASVTEDRWERAQADIEAAAKGELDTLTKVAERASAYESQSGPDRKPSVECFVDSATGDVVIVVKCTDRIGRLAEILAALGACGLEVRLAKLDSRGDELVDTFHVRDKSFDSDENAVRGLEQLIAAGISP